MGATALKPQCRPCGTDYTDGDRAPSAGVPLERTRSRSRPIPLRSRSDERAETGRRNEPVHQRRRSTPHLRRWYAVPDDDQSTGHSPARARVVSSSLPDLLQRGTLSARRRSPAPQQLSHSAVC